MKALKTTIFICFILLLFAGMARAETQVTFAWDAVKSEDLAGYRLYQSKTSGKYTYGKDQCAADIPAGTETATLEAVPDGAWYWVATAYDHEGNETGPSNEVTATFDTTPPGLPPNLKITMAIKITVEMK